MASPEAETPAPREADGGRQEGDLLGGDHVLDTAKIFAAQLKFCAAFIAQLDPAALAALAFLVIGEARR